MARRASLAEDSITIVAEASAREAALVDSEVAEALSVAEEQDADFNFLPLLTRGSLLLKKQKG